MKKQVLFIIGLLVSTSALAAPTGHQVCKDASGRSDIQLTVATYALSGDTSILKLNGNEFGFEVGAGEGTGTLSTLMKAFCLCEPKLGLPVGEVKWDITQGDANDFSAINLTIIDQDKKAETVSLTCAPADHTAGSEQN